MLLKGGDNVLGSRPWPNEHLCEFEKISIENQGLKSTNKKNEVEPPVAKNKSAEHKKMMGI